MRNRDELEGKGEQMKGRVKEGAGNLVNDERLRNEGQADQAGGEMQEGFGKARRKVGETMDDMADRIKGT